VKILFAEAAAEAFAERPQSARKKSSQLDWNCWNSTLECTRYGGAD
jgi:hypothetical protein